MYDSILDEEKLGLGWTFVLELKDQEICVVWGKGWGGKMLTNKIR